MEAIRGRGDKGTSLDLDAVLWAIQVVSSPARLDGSVTRTDPSGGRRRPGTGRARSSNRLQAGRPAIGLERRPVGVGSGIGVESFASARPESPFGTGGRGGSPGRSPPPNCRAAIASRPSTAED